jgi:hypothetical protein
MGYRHSQRSQRSTCSLPWCIYLHRAASSGRNNNNTEDHIWQQPRGNYSDRRTAVENEDRKYYWCQFLRCTVPAHKIAKDGAARAHALHLPIKQNNKLGFTCWPYPLEYGGRGC